MHTYKNAFIGVNRLSQAALKNLDAQNLDNVSSCLEVMRTLSDEQLRLINKTLWFLKGINLDQYVVDMAECVETAIAQAAIPAHIQISFQKSEESFLVMGDQGHLIEAVANILQNSVSALDGVLQPAIQIHLSKDKDKVFMIVDIHDNGKGIHKKDMKHIFKPFYSGKSRVTGSGVGLTYVKNVMRLHRGDIEVKSEVDIYTVFKLILPLLQQKNHVRRKNNEKNQLGNL